MVTSSYSMNKGQEFYANQVSKSLELPSKDSQRIKHLESCCSKWAETISNWSLPAKIATFILTLPFAPVLLPVYAMIRFMDTETKTMVKKIKSDCITTATSNLIKTIANDLSFNLQSISTNFCTILNNKSKKIKLEITKHLNHFDESISLINPNSEIPIEKQREEALKNFYQFILLTCDNDKVKAFQFLDIIKREPEILNQLTKDAQRGLISIANEKPLHESALIQYKKSSSTSPNFSILCKKLDTSFKDLSADEQALSKKKFDEYIKNPSTYAKDKTTLTHSNAEAFALDLIDEITKKDLASIIKYTVYGAVCQKFPHRFDALKFLDLCQQSTIINTDKAPFQKAVATINDTSSNSKSINYIAGQNPDKNTHLIIDIKNKTITTKSHLSIKKSGLDDDFNKIDDTLFNIEVNGVFAFNKGVSQTFKVTSTPGQNRDQKTQEAATKIQLLFQETLEESNPTISISEDSALSISHHSSSTINSIS